MDTKRITDIPGMAFLWKVDNLYLAGQPAVESFEHLKALGIKKVINLRSSGEKDFSPEISKIEELGMSYEQFPILDTHGHLCEENCKKLSEMIDTENIHFIHCGSANRVAGWLMTYLVLYRDFGFEAAVEIATHSGLSSNALIDQAQTIIDKAQG